MSSEPHSRRLPVRKRRRPALACEQCRQRKIKCDRNSPCNNCIKSRISSCTYVPDTRLSTHNSAPHEISFSIVSSNNSTSDSGQNSNLETKVPSPSTRDASHEIHALKDRIRQLEQKLGESGKGQVTAYTCKPPDMSDTYTSNSLRGIFSKQRFRGESHWLNFLQPFSTVLNVIRQYESEQDSQVRDDFAKCKAIGRSIKARLSLPHTVLVNLSEQVPGRSVADALVSTYLRTYETVFRVLYVPAFLAEYEQYWLSPGSTTQPFAVKLLLIMSLGSTVTSYQHPIISRWKTRQWTYTAQSWLGVVEEKTRISLEGLQTHCLLILARQANAVRGGSVWMSVGTLLRDAMHMGLHVGPKYGYLPHSTMFQIETRRRLWATILELVVQSAMDAGGLPLLHPDEFDCFPPSNVNDSDINEEVPSAVSSSTRPAEEFTQSSIQTALLRSLPLRLKIAKFINNFKSDMKYEETLRLAAEMTQILKANAQLLRKFRTAGTNPSSFQINLLNLMTHRFLFALHYPFAVRAKTETSYYYSRKICLESALMLAPSSDSTSDEEFHSLCILGTGMFRNVGLLAVGYICGELIDQMESSASLYAYANMNSNRRELLSIIENYVVLIAARVEAGEVNIKGHVFVSCLSAQINAMQDGQPVEAAISAALKTSLRFSLEMLEKCAEQQQESHGHPSAEPLLKSPITDAQLDWFQGDDMVGFPDDSIMQDPSWYDFSL